MNQPPTTTTMKTIVRSSAALGGWHDLRVDAGLPHRGPVPDVGAHALATVLHMSDTHLCDAESPARLEYLDRYADPDSPYRHALGDIGTYRPQEIFTAHVAIAMVQAANAIEQGPVGGAALDAVLVTGDLTDNAQWNERDWYQTIMRGGMVRTSSGSMRYSAWVGSKHVEWDDRYWHPDGPPPGQIADRPTRIYGFPNLPDVVDMAREDVLSPGLRVRCLSVHGNHDALLQGTVRPNAALRGLAVGSVRITSLAPGGSLDSIARAISESGPAAYPHDETSPWMPHIADPSRRIVGPGDFARAFGIPEGRSWFATDIGELRLIVLDTVNPHGGWQGSLSSEQFDWLRMQLRDAHDRYTVVASHHPSWTMTNAYQGSDAQPRILGPDVVRLLLDHPAVIAWLSGHVHEHTARHHGRPGSGFWEITTGSLIDWPQQARILEFLRTAGPNPAIHIASTLIDHEGPADFRDPNRDPCRYLASVSRALAANDYQRDALARNESSRSSAARGNAVWTVADPLAARH